MAADSEAEAEEVAVQARTHKVGMVGMAALLKLEAQEASVGRRAPLAAEKAAMADHNPAIMALQDMLPVEVVEVQNRSLTIRRTGPVEQEPQEGWS